LSWADNSANEDGFRIERALHGSTNFAIIGTVAAGATAFTDSDATLTEGTRYDYRVSAYSTAGSSALAGPVAAWTKLTSPTAVTATAAVSTSVTVAWTDNSQKETGFAVDYSTSSAFAAATTLNVSGANTASATVSGLSTGTTYYFRVRATGANVDSLNSTAAAATTPGGLTVSRSPAGSVSEGSAVTLTAAYTTGTPAPGTTFAWTITKDGSAYALSAGSSISFTPGDDGAYAATIIATAPDGQSESVASAFEVTDVAPVLALTGNAQANVDAVYLLSVDVSDPGNDAISSYLIDWGDNSDPDGDGQVGELVQGGPSTVGHTYAAPGTYAIHLLATSEDGSYSAPVKTVTASYAAPAAPSGLVADEVTASGLRLSWVDHAGDETGFRIYYSKNGSGFHLLPDGDVAASAGIGQPVGHVVSGLQSGATYAFRVAAVRGGTESARSAPAIAATLSAAGQALTIEGPQSVTSGTGVRFTARGGAGAAVSDPVTYIWTVTSPAGKTVASGQGAALGFLPTTAGAYTISLVALASGGAASTSASLSVATPAIAPCEILGPPDAEVGRIAAFSVPLRGLDVGEWSEEGDAITLDWVAKDASGQVVQSHHGVISEDEMEPDVVPPQPRFAFVASEVGTYLIEVKLIGYNGNEFRGSVVIDAAVGAPDTFKKHFSDFSFDFENPSTVIEDRQGNFVSAGFARSFRNAHGYVPEPDSGWFRLSSGFTQADTDFNMLVLTKVDASLQPVTSFGTNGKVAIPWGGFLAGNRLGAPTIVRESEDGQLLIATTASSGGSRGVLLVRLDGETGQADTSFGINGFSFLSAEIPDGAGGDRLFANVGDMALQPDGKIVLVGLVAHNRFEGGISLLSKSSGALRLNADGTLDTSFGDGGLRSIPLAGQREAPWAEHELTDYQRETARSVLIQPDGSIILAGSMTRYFVFDPSQGSLGRRELGRDLYIAKLDADGDLDTSFGDEGSGTSRFNFGYTPSALDAHVASSVGLIGNFVAQNLLQDSHGRLIVVGGYTEDHLNEVLTYPVANRIFLAGFTNDGILDPSYGTNTSIPGTTIVSLYGNDDAWSSVLTADDKIVVAGYTDSGGLIARYDGDGALDSGFGNNGKIILDSGFKATWHSAVIASDNAIVVAGYAGQSDGNGGFVDGFGIAKYRPGDVSAGDLVATARLDGDVDLTWVDTGTG
ncbi:MAG TPA: fibronectin type III domain-containing protein, partial [Tepidisphaeraceae bacterium]